MNTWVAAGATTGVILSAAYALWLYRRVIFGDLVKHSLAQIKDVSTREKWLFLPLIVATILLGISPGFVLDIIGPSVDALIENFNAATAHMVDTMAAAPASH